MAAAPSDFVFDTETGEFSFTANDPGIGYYFVRVYSASSGEEAAEYTASSKRINGGRTGAVTGKVSLDSIGWGPYHIKLISSAAAGSACCARSTGVSRIDSMRRALALPLEYITKMRVIISSAFRMMVK